jgi:hypothetical protein
MTGPGPDIGTALSGDGPISSRFYLGLTPLRIRTCHSIYALSTAGEGSYRIQPELGGGPTCALIQRYLLGCIRDGVTDAM